MPQALAVKSEFYSLFGMFATAVVEKPERFHACFGTLLKHLDRETIDKLATSAPADVATTILAFLPESVQKSVADYLRANPDKRTTILEAVKSAQQELRRCLADFAAEAAVKPELRLLK